MIFFEWKDISKLDNMALPVRNATNKSGLCPELSSIFKVSDSTNYDYEILKEPFTTSFMKVRKETLNINKAESYDDSIFGQLEERLIKKDLKDICEKNI